MEEHLKVLKIQYSIAIRYNTIHCNTACTCTCTSTFEWVYDSVVYSYLLLIHFCTWTCILLPYFPGYKLHRSISCILFNLIYMKNCTMETFCFWCSDQILTCEN